MPLFILWRKTIAAPYAFLMNQSISFVIFVCLSNVYKISVMHAWAQNIIDMLLYKVQSHRSSFEYDNSGQEISVSVTTVCEFIIKTQEQ